VQPAEHMWMYILSPALQWYKQGVMQNLFIGHALGFLRVPRVFTFSPVPAAHWYLVKEQCGCWVKQHMLRLNCLQSSNLSVHARRHVDS
jgi:hypothetical protein